LSEVVHPRRHANGSGDLPPSKNAASASTTTPPTYSAWRDAAGKDLAERHGLRINVRKKQWREWYIEGMTPAEAADRAAADHDAMRPLVDRDGRRRRQ
jgi:hypothetical protein